jgi:hypothetical protein
MNYLRENLKTCVCISCFPWELLTRRVIFVISLEITRKGAQSLQIEEEEDGYNTWVRIPSHCRPLILPSERQHQVDIEPTWNRVNNRHSLYWFCFRVFAGSGCGHFCGVCRNSGHGNVIERFQKLSHLDFPIWPEQATALTLPPVGLVDQISSLSDPNQPLSILIILLFFLGLHFLTMLFFSSPPISFILLLLFRRRDSVVGVATGYGLDVRVLIESRVFSSPRRPDRLWVQLNLLLNGYRRLFPQGQNGRGVKLTTHLQLLARSRKCRSIHPLPHMPSWRSA